jgi:predicted RNase H-like HicB family nuclease
MFGTGRTYTVAIYETEPDETGWWCEVIDLPGCVAQGETLDELRINMVEAIIACEETRREMGGGPPLPRVDHTWNVSIPGDVGVGGLVPSA